MLPRLQAEEQLSTLNLLTAGGSMVVDAKAYRRMVAGLEATASGESVRPRRRAVSAAELQAAGITVEQVPV